MLNSIINAKSYVYVTDMVPIPMRSENIIKNNPSNLIKMLNSNTKLEILATKDGWTKVKFKDTVGWIVSRYLTSNIPTKIQLENLQRNDNLLKLSLSKQNKENTILKKQTSNLKIKNTQLSIQVGKLKSEEKYIRQICKDALMLEHNNKNLKINILQLETELQLLQNNNIIEQETIYRNWFIIGALVLFFGIMIGFIFQKLTNNKRT